MARRDLQMTIFCGVSPFRYMDRKRFWELVDMLEPDECTLIRLLWQEDYRPTDITLQTALRQTGYKPYVLDRALRKLRHPLRIRQYVLRTMPSVEYGYA